MFAHLLIIIVCIMIALVASFDKRVNVGTVLFSQSDLQKVNWDSSELGLLKARRYFQKLLPSSNFVDTANEDYINMLLRYLKNTYTSVKRETANETVSRMMTVALSDVVGGYLKFWALPVTKIGFYGGTISQNNVMKLSQFYDELKDFLDTDGNGWRNPNRNVLHDKAINIAPLRHFRRSMKHPCSQLVFEETPNGLTIPVPYIHWGNKSTMIVPMKRNSIVYLESPHQPNYLVKYYDAAKSCIEETTIDGSEFEYKFQTWLQQDVVPHLCDDKIYFSFGKVLSLVNRTRMKKCYERYNKVVIGGIHLDFSSTRTLIVFIILILEVVWCIPALFYLACTRRVKKKLNLKKDSGTITDLLCGKNHSKPLRNIYEKIKEKKRKLMNTNQCSIFEGEAGGLKLEQKPRNKFAFDALCSVQPESEPHITSAKPTVSFEHEMTNIPLESSMRRLYSSHSSRSRNSIAVTQTKSKSSKSCISSSHVCTCSKCTIYGSVYNVKSFISENNSIAFPYVASESIKDSVTEILSNVTYVKSVTDNFSKSMDSKISIDNDISRKESFLDPEIKCPCLSCLENTNDSIVTVLNQESPVVETIFENKMDSNTQARSTDTRASQLPVIKESICRNVGLNLDTEPPSCFEINIDEPRTKISVGITGHFKKKKTKPSRIPKRLPNISVQLTCQSSKESRPPSRNRSLIPQPKRGVDDIAIQLGNTAHKYINNKLNVTL